MNVLKHIGLVAILTLAAIPTLPAKELADYVVGDIVSQDIATPVALDVVNPDATTALRASEAQKIPAIFRSLSNTNTMSVAFVDAFEVAHTNFLAQVQETFHQPQLDDTTIASGDFGYLVTAFNIKNRSFPVSDDLAADWARGKPGLALENKLLITLQRLMQNRVCPDELPQGLPIGNTIRVIPANGFEGRDSVGDIAQNGELIPTSSLITLSNLKVMYRREFPVGEQPLARAISEYLTANCLPDHELTVLVRDRAVNQLVVTVHYAPGEVIARRGTKVDPQTKIALYQLNDRLASEPALAMVAPAPASAAPTPTPPAPAPQPAAIQSKPVSNFTGDSTPTTTVTMPDTDRYVPWLIIGVSTTVCVLAVSISVVIILRRRKTSNPLSTVATPVAAPVAMPMTAPLARMSPVTMVGANIQGMSQNELAPIVQAVKEAFVQELASQRRELIFAQQQAAAEITQLVRRLDDLQTPLQQRLRTYESEIRRLEKELAERTEENVELLKLKIQLTQDQMATEAIHNRAAASKSPVEGLFN